MKPHHWIILGALGCLLLNPVCYYRQESLWEPANNATVIGDTAGVESALRSGLNINWSPGDGTTLLIVAVQNNQPSVVELLLDNHADPMLRDKYGRTARDYVDAKTQPRIAELLGVKANKPRNP